LAPQSHTTIDLVGGDADRWERPREVRTAADYLSHYQMLLPVIMDHHYQAVPAAAEHARLDRLARRAVAEADRLYADLGKDSTVDWRAARHQFVEACIRAWQLLTGRLVVARALAGGKFGRDMATLCRLVYERAVPAQHRIVLPDVDGEYLAVAEFVELTRTRLDILCVTAAGGYPPGFAPSGRPTGRASVVATNGRAR
jgi:hypothetical protein